MKHIGSGIFLVALLSGCIISVGASDNSQAVDAPEIDWVEIGDPGFVGQMSKYEITNTQYARYLNDAQASGDILVDGDAIRGNTGPYTGENYYRTDGPAFNYIDSVDGGKSRISFDGTTFTVNEGFEEHPVTFVSWYGAMAFAGYYGWRLPTEWEWQAAADYDGSYTYGCGTEINSQKANYERTIFPHGTCEVGRFGVFGYGLADIAGSVAEWTNSLWSPQYKHVVYRGGGWYCGANLCEVSHRDLIIPGAMWPNIGFRVCR